jgi:bifunctional non-homologous end joining protein LigD
MSIADPLKTYRAKRDFTATPEPAGDSSVRAPKGRKKGSAVTPGGQGTDASAQALRFVVQKHWASRLHYDFRLELDGTMKSWAVPKGPSLDPADKRMAVQVEDHPIDYNRFEGTIPKGHYGAGRVIVWDRGTWTPEGDAARGLRDGHLKFALDGIKLRGRWALVRMKDRGERQPAWLLIKERDDAAQPAAQFSVVDALPDSVGPDAARAPHAKAAAGKAASATVSSKASSKASAKATAKASSSNVSSATAGAAKAGRQAAVRTSRRSAAPEASGTPPAGARPAPLPASFSPQLATLVDAPPANAADWLYEIKFDGYRLLTRIDQGEVRLFTRNGHDWTARLPALARALARIPLTNAWLDGEIVALGEGGAPDFQRLQNAFDAGRTADVIYYLFDLPYCHGHDLGEVALEQRRAILAEAVRRADAGPAVRFSETFDAAGQDVVHSACALGLEGVIGKRRGAPYVQRRSADWIKLKCGRRQEFVIAGFTEPQGSRAGLGALILGVYDAQGRLHHAGNVGTGFTQASLQELRNALDALASDTNPLEGAGPWPRQVHWVRPRLVAEVAFGEWTREGRIRHPVFHGLRADRDPRSVRRETAAPPSAAPQAAPLATTSAAGAAPSAAPARKLAPARAAAAGSRQRITHPERLIDPASGVTKLDLVRHYEAVADAMLPHLRGRPVAMLRAPDGVGGELFFQKHPDTRHLPGVRQLDRALDPGHAPTVEIASAAGLVSAAQFNMVELHTWNAVKQRIDRPDRMTFDLDPGEGVAWAQVQEGALLVRTLLTELGLPAFLKTSGGKGLHVVVPLKRLQGWDTVKGFSQAIVRHLAATVPQRFVAKSGPKNRVGRIFVDYLRNGFGATTVCAWSARARPGMGVSVPVTWDELPELTGSAHWTVTNVGERIATGNQPWADYEASAAALTAAMKMLDFEG